MNLKFRKIDIASQNDTWNFFVLNQPIENYHLGHNPSFASIFNKYYGFTPAYYLVYKSDIIVGVIPGLTKNHKYFSLPVLPCGGFCIDKSIDRIKLYKEFVGRYVDDYEIRDFVKFSDYSYDGKVSCYLYLKDSVENQWDHFKSKHRSQIKKGFKNGLYIKVGNQEYLNQFYSIYRKNMHRCGTPVSSKKYFSTFIGEYQHGKCKIFVVCRNSDVLGAGIYFSYGEFGEIFWASTLREFNYLNTNMVLYWGMIEYAIKDGMKILSFGRSTNRSSGLKFKEQWLCETYQLYFNYSEKKKNIRENKLYKRIWQSIPYPIANLVGPVIRKKVIS